MGPLVRKLRVLDPWVSHRDFRFLWIGNFFANNAQWLQLLTLGWLVQWLEAGSGRSALLVILVGGIITAPTLLVGPWGGVLGDRIDRRKLVIAIQSMMAVTAFTFALVVLSDRVQVWHVYGYALIAGICMSLVQPNRQALIANTVPRSAIPNAYAANVLTITGTRILSPVIGGILISTTGFFWNFSLEALLYIAMILSFVPMRTPYSVPQTGVGKTDACLNGVAQADLKNVVIFCPHNIVYQWAEFIDQAYPDADIITRKEVLDPDVKFIKGHKSFYICSYALMSLPVGRTIISKLLKQPVDFIVFDEVQNVKIRDKRDPSIRRVTTEQFVKDCRTQRKVKVAFMSATPVVNNLQAVSYTHLTLPTILLV